MRTVKVFVYVVLATFMGMALLVANASDIDDKYKMYLGFVSGKTDTNQPPPTTTATIAPSTTPDATTEPASPTPTSTLIPPPQPTLTATPTLDPIMPTPEPTITATPTATTDPSLPATPEPTPASTLTATPTPVITPTNTVEPTLTATPTPAITPTDTPEPTPEPTNSIEVISNGNFVRSANESSGIVDMSPNGRYLVFDSIASNIIPNDTNGLNDVFVYDRETGATTRLPFVIHPSRKLAMSISDTGRVAFVSGSSTIVPNDTNVVDDIFVYDLSTQSVSRISVASDTSQSNGESFGPHISPNGRFVAFESQASNLVAGDTNNRQDIFVHDLQTSQTSRVSVASDGTEANHVSFTANISDDGRFVAFLSIASNLVPNDTNDIRDVFLHDRQTGITTRVSMAWNGTQADHVSYNPLISSDNKVVIFESEATNLVADDTNGQMDIFAHDLEAGFTTRVSMAWDGAEGNNSSSEPSISANGRYIAFQSYATNLVPNDTNNDSDAFVYDRETGSTTRLSVASDGSQANNYSLNPLISRDGRFVFFESSADNLAPNDLNDRSDVFLHDLQESTTSLVSVDFASTFTNGHSSFASVSADGRYIAYQSYASNLVANDTNESYDIFVYDSQTDTTERVSVASDGSQGNHSSNDAHISADGRFVVFSSEASNLVANDTNNAFDSFVHDRQTGETTRVSVASNGAQANGSSSQVNVSADGRFVVFSSEASNLVANDTNNASDIFVHDRQTGETTRVSVASDGTQANSGSYGFTISITADGRYVAFASAADNLVANDTNGVADIFVHDRQTGTTTRVSVASDGTQANHYSEIPMIAANGRYVTFTSPASNLVPNDTNNSFDVFVHDLQDGITTRVSLAWDGSNTNHLSGIPSISADGRYITFESAATNIVAGHTSNHMNVFVHDQLMGKNSLVSVTSRGEEVNGYSAFSQISADGKSVVFESVGTNFLPNDIFERSKIVLVRFGS